MEKNLSELEKLSIEIYTRFIDLGGIYFDRLEDLEENNEKILNELMDAIFSCSLTNSKKYYNFLKVLLSNFHAYEWYYEENFLDDDKPVRKLNDEKIKKGILNSQLDSLLLNYIEELDDVYELEDKLKETNRMFLLKRALIRLIFIYSKEMNEPGFVYKVYIDVIKMIEQRIINQKFMISNNDFVLFSNKCIGFDVKANDGEGICDYFFFASEKLIEDEKEDEIVKEFFNLFNYFLFNFPEYKKGILFDIGNSFFYNLLCMELLDEDYEIKLTDYEKSLIATMEEETFNLDQLFALIYSDPKNITDGFEAFAKSFEFDNVIEQKLALKDPLETNRARASIKRSEEFAKKIEIKGFNLS